MGITVAMGQHPERLLAGDQYPCWHLPLFTAKRCSARRSASASSVWRTLIPLITRLLPAHLPRGPMPAAPGGAAVVALVDRFDRSGRGVTSTGSTSRTCRAQGQGRPCELIRIPRPRRGRASGRAMRAFRWFRAGTHQSLMGQLSHLRAARRPVSRGGGRLETPQPQGGGAAKLKRAPRREGNKRKTQSRRDAFARQPWALEGGDPRGRLRQAGATCK